MIRLPLPWPPKSLLPNARVHHFAKAKETKLYRENAYWSLKAGRAGPWQGDGPILLSFTFWPPDRRRRDLDGMFSAMKSAIDGIADALEVNDIRFEFAIKRAEPKPPAGKIMVVIGEDHPISRANLGVGE